MGNDLRALQGLLRLKARRAWNRWTRGWGSRRKKKLQDPLRNATPRKGRASPILVVFLFIVFLFNGLNLSVQAIRALQDQLGPKAPPPALDLSVPPPGWHAPDWKSMDEESRSSTWKQYQEFEKKLGRLPPITSAGVMSKPYLSGVAFLAAILFFALVFSSLGFANNDLARLDLDVEWFLTLPVSTAVVYASKVFERTLLNFVGWFTFAPFYGCVFWFWGYGWWALPIAVGLTLVTHFLIGVVQFVMEIAFRRMCTPYGLRNVQAGATVLGLLLYMITLSICFPIARSNYFLFDWIRSAGVAAEYLPMGVALSWLRGVDVQAGLNLMLILAEVGLIVLGGWWMVGWASARGLEAVQGGYRGSRGTAPASPGRFLSGIVGKDLRLLVRDKALLVQIGLVPLLVVVIQLLFNPEVLNDSLGQPQLWGAVAFGIGGYALMSSVTGVLLHERDALWMMYTFPRSMGRMVIGKAWIWIGLAMIYSLAAFFMGVAHRGAIGGEDTKSLIWILTGIPLLGMIGAALGVLASDPLATEPQHRSRVDIIYLFMMLGGMMTGGLYLPDPWSQFVCMIVFAALAVALWQKASDRVDYLLDPVALPPKRIDLADGLIGVVIFFFVQVSIAVLCLSSGMELRTVILISYPAAAAVSSVLVLYALWRHGIRPGELLRLWKAGSFLRSCALGVMGGGMAVAIGLLYLWALPRELARESETQARQLLGWELAAVGVVAAPFFEEIIFRGLVFRGLRLRTGLWSAALFSALIFAVVHPPVSLVPVFIVGVILAWVFEKSGGLLAPILVHMIYNGIIIFLSSFQ